MSTYIPNIFRYQCWCIVGIISFPTRHLFLILINCYFSFSTAIFAFTFLEKCWVSNQRLLAPLREVIKYHTRAFSHLFRNCWVSNEPISLLLWFISPLLLIMCFAFCILVLQLSSLVPFPHLSSRKIICARHIIEWKMWQLNSSNNSAATIKQ